MEAVWISILVVCVIVGRAAWPKPESPAVRPTEESLPPFDLTGAQRRPREVASALPSLPRPVAPPPAPAVVTLTGPCWVEDGDTIYIGGRPIRLAGIDAPEIDQPYGKKAKFTLIALCRGRNVTAVFTGEQSYRREIATCLLDDGRDLSAEMVKLGVALDWRKFSGGKYRQLEPPDARRKLWRVDAKHKGRYPPPGSGQLS
jgi:micrococcal nuclease